MLKFDDMIDIGAMGMGRYWVVLMADFTARSDDYFTGTATKWIRESLREVDVPSLTVTDRQWIMAIIGD